MLNSGHSSAQRFTVLDCTSWCSVPVAGFFFYSWPISHLDCYAICKHVGSCDLSNPHGWRTVREVTLNHNGLFVVSLCTYPVCAVLPPLWYTPYTQRTAIVQMSCMPTLRVLRSMSVMVQVQDFQAVIGKEARQQCLECTAIVQSSCMQTLRVLRSVSVTV